MAPQPNAPETIEKVLAMYAAGHTYQAINLAIGSPARSGRAWHILNRCGKELDRLRRVTQDQLDRAAAAYAAGATLENAAAAGRCSTLTVWKHLKQLGLLRPWPVRRIDQAAVLDLHRSGLTPWEIAHQLGLNLNDVLSVIRQNSFHGGKPNGDENCADSND